MFGSELPSSSNAFKIDQARALLNTSAWVIARAFSEKKGVSIDKKERSGMSAKTRMRYLIPFMPKRFKTITAISIELIAVYDNEFY